MDQYWDNSDFDIYFNGLAQKSDGENPRMSCVYEEDILWIKSKFWNLSE